MHKLLVLDIDSRGLCFMGGGTVEMLHSLLDFAHPGTGTHIGAIAVSLTRAS